MTSLAGSDRIHPARNSTLPGGCQDPLLPENHRFGAAGRLDRGCPGPPRHFPPRINSFTPTGRSRYDVAFTNSVTPERWLSGRKRSPAKGVGANAPRGFESLSLRQVLTQPGKRPSDDLTLKPGSRIMRASSRDDQPKTQAETARNTRARHRYPAVPINKQTTRL